ncbi:MAG: Ig-like domain-containing protein, partial [Solirubrobacterales bacterium]
IGPGGALTSRDCVAADSDIPDLDPSDGDSTNDCMGVEDRTGGTFVGGQNTGLAGLSDLAVSADGARLYAAASFDAAVARFELGPGGALTYLDCVAADASIPDLDPSDGDSTNDCTGVEDPASNPSPDLDNGDNTGLAGLNALALSADGASLYATASFDAAVARFDLGAGGALTYVDCIAADPDIPDLDRSDGDSTNDCAGVEDLGGFIGVESGLGGLGGLALSADGASLYTAASSDAAVARFARELDTTAPETAIDSGPGALTADPTPTFTFSSPDPQLAGFQCSTDGGAFGPCSGEGTHTTAPLADGVHDFQVRARDRAGNPDASPATRAFLVDTAPDDTTPGDTAPGDQARGDAAVPETTAPRVFFLRRPPNRLVLGRRKGSRNGKRAAAAARRARARWRFVADEPGVRYQCRLKNGPKRRRAFFPCSSPHTERLRPGRGRSRRYTLVVRAIDVAGNVGSSTRDRLRVRRRR